MELKCVFYGCYNDVIKILIKNICGDQINNYSVNLMKKYILIYDEKYLSFSIERLEVAVEEALEEVSNSTLGVFVGVLLSIVGMFLVEVLKIILNNAENRLSWFDNTGAYILSMIIIFTLLWCWVKVQAMEKRKYLCIKCAINEIKRNSTTIESIC